MSRILVVGAGGIGGYVTCVLARGGADVTLLARGESAKVIAEDGLRIDGGPAAGVSRPPVVEQLGRDESYDVVMVATKTYDSPAVVAGLADVLADDGVVVMLQNGVGRGAAASEQLGRDAGLDGVVYLEARLTEPGVVTYFSGAGRIEIGDPARPVADRAEPLAALLRGFGVDAVASADPTTAAWRKLVLVAAANALTGATRKPFGAIVSSRTGRSAAAELLREGTEVARADGADLPPEYADESMRFLESMGPTLRSSMLHDVERGRRTEVAALNGEIVRRGSRLGVPVPLHELMLLVLGDDEQVADVEAS